MGDEKALRDDARARLAGLGPEMPDAASINALAGDTDADVASSAFYEAILRDPSYGDFIRKVDASPDSAARISDAPLLIIVPGMFYREYPDIGADGSLIAGIAERFGLDVLRVPTSSLGSITENLEVLHTFLAREAKREFCLVSMSRGSAEVKWLLQRYPDAPYLDNLRTWISICGILSGTPLHEHIYSNRVFRTLHRGLARINRINPELGEELLRSRDHWAATRIPPQATQVNVIAVPLSWHVTGSAIRRYRRICHLGPTDGVVLLTDYLDEPGMIYPVWGVDHFLRSTRIAAMFYQLLSFLMAPGRTSNEKGETLVVDCAAAADAKRTGTGSVQR